VIGEQTIKGDRWPISLALGLAALAVLLQQRVKVPEPAVVAAAALAGIALS
jgi:hypothetical protein